MGEIDFQATALAVFERLGGVRHGARVDQLRRASGVDGAEFFAGFDDTEFQATGVKRVVVVDGRTFETEEDAAVGQIEADSHFGVALVGPVSQADKAANGPIGIEEVEVHALVEIRLFAQGMGVVVPGDQIADDLCH